MSKVFASTRSPQGVPRVWTVEQNGSITCTEDFGEDMNFKLAELLYMIQEYQTVCGPIEIPINPSEWRGIKSE